MNIALVGNQNTGKTTLFNSLTGSNRRVGNFPGVTVELSIGKLKGNKDYNLIDLPGVYSLSPCSDEEKITYDYLQKEEPCCIINILDATNLNRNLYLTMQLLESQTPVILALNMMDEVEKNGGHIDTSALSKLLNVPVVAVSAIKGRGVEELIQKTVDLCKNPIKRTSFFPYSPRFSAVKRVGDILNSAGLNKNLAVKVFALEGVDTNLPLLNIQKKKAIDDIIQKTEREYQSDRQAFIADMRYDAIERICQKVVKKEGINRGGLLSEKMDKVLTHKYLSIPIFLIVMGLIFYLTFGLIGKYMSERLSESIIVLSKELGFLLAKWGVSAWLISFIVDGFFAGVGSVMSFLPMIVLLFFFLSIIEDTGYMARVAFVMDRLLKRIGLTGRSIVPMLIGFGCSVPAYMSIRTLPSERDKKLTAFLIPFMSCSAKIPIYAIFASVLFESHQWLVVLFIYVLGIVVGIIYALILQKTIYKGASSSFVMELPPYRLPSLKTVFIYLADKARGFITKAFTIILMASVVIWFLRSFDFSLNMAGTNDASMLAVMAKQLADIFSPLGFGDWRFTTAIITGLIAKESVISTLFVLLGVQSGGFGGVLTGLLTPLQGLSFLVFCSLYMPCIAAFAAFKKEFGSWKLTLSAMTVQNLIAYIVSFFVYTFGLLFTL